MNSIFHSFQALAFWKERPWYWTIVMYILAGILEGEQIIKRLKTKVQIWKMKCGK